jgi:hypothetical protein
VAGLAEQCVGAPRRFRQIGEPVAEKHTAHGSPVDGLSPPGPTHRAPILGLGQDETAGPGP